MKNRIVLLSLMLMCFTSFAFAENAATEDNAEAKSSKKYKLPKYGIELSTYLPTNSDTRNAFGSNWVSVGFGLGSIVNKKGLNYRFDFQVFDNNASRASNEKAALFVLGIQARVGQSDPFYFKGGKRNVRVFNPYYGSALNVVYGDVSSNLFGVGMKRVGFGAGAFVGATIKANLYFEARYQVFTKFSGIDFNGLSLTAGVRF